MIDPDLEREILRLFYAERWKVGTIAMQLRVHHTTVQRVLDNAGVPKTKYAPRASIIDPYVPFVLETLDKYPKVPASRVYEMVRQRGYGGKSEAHFRRFVARHRPKHVSHTEAYHRLRTLPGEQCQVDWGHFGYLEIGRAKRPLMAFVLVMSYSRQIFLKFAMNQRLPAFLEGHMEAFETFGGVPRVALYDNLKSVVLERYGQVIQFNKTLLEFASHYRYEPRPVAVGRGNEKGRVERAIRYIRQSFWPARTFRDLDDLNEQATTWCQELAAKRPCPEDRSLTVQQAWEDEKDKLMKLPNDRFPIDEIKELRVGKTPYIRFDLNDYSVPHTYSRRIVTVVASKTRIRVLDGEKVVAEHERSYNKGSQIENEAHIRELTEKKQAARRARNQDRLMEASPKIEKFLSIAVQQGANIGSFVRQLTNLLDTYGASEFDKALEDVLECNVIYPNAVKFCLEKRRHDQNLPPALPIKLPDDPRIKNLVVQPHQLSWYDFEEKHEDDPTRTR